MTILLGAFFSFGITLQTGLPLIDSSKGFPCWINFSKIPVLRTVVIEIAVIAVGF